MNFNMHRMNKTLGELFTMLKVAEKDIQKDANHVMMVKKSVRFKKKQNKKQAKKSRGVGSATTPKKSKAGPSSNDECFFCKEMGHWKRNFPKYLAEKKKTGSLTSSSGIFYIHVIDVFLMGPKSNSWVFDTGSVANIYNTMQGLRMKC